MPPIDLGLAAFGCLGIAIASLWIFEGPIVWNGLMLTAVALALSSDVMNGWGLVAGAAAGGAVYGTYRVPASKPVKTLLAVIMTVLTLGLFGHLLPGFENKILFSNIVLSPGAYPTSIIWSFDKPLAGLLLMGWGHPRVRSGKEWRRVLTAAGPLFLACAGLMLSVAWPLHVLRWAPKLNVITAVFAFGNLLFACIPEEAFFRGFIQRKLSDVFAGRARGGVLSVVIAALIFGLCHFVGGIGLMLAATAAGLFYGAAYQRTGRIEAAILVHLLLNFTHFAFFTYPALRQP